MKITAIVTINFSPAITRANFRTLSNMVKNRSRCAPNYLCAEYVLPSVEFEKLYQAAQSVGLSIWMDFDRMPRDDEFQIDGRLEFEESDLAEGRYAQAKFEHNFSNCETEQTARPPRFTLPLTEFNVDEIEHATRDKLYRGELHMADSSYFFTLVSDHFKKRFEAADIGGVDFLDGFRPKGKFAARVKGKYWLFVPRKKIKVADDERGFLRQVQRLVSDKEVAAQVAKQKWINMLEAKSVARHEPFEVAQASTKKGTGFIIGTEKFRQFCREAGAEVTWTPLPISSE